MQLWGQSLLMLPEATGCFDSDTLAQAAQLSSVRPQLVPLQWLTADLPSLRRATWRPFLPLLCCRGRPSPSSAWLTFVSTAELGATGNSWMKHGLCFPLHWWISFLVRYDGASDHVMFFFSFPFPFYCQHPCRPGSLLYGVGTFSPCLCGFSSLLLPPPTFQRRDWWIELLYWPQVWMCGWMVVPQLSHVNATGRGSSPQTTPVWDKSMDDEWKNSIIVQLS